MNPTWLRRLALLLVTVIALAACSGDDGGDDAGGDDGSASPPLAADDSGTEGPAALAPSTTVPVITPSSVADDTDCPEGRVRWVTERTSIEDERQSQPTAWRISVTGRVENRTTARIVSNIQDLEIFIYRPPAWDGLRAFHASAPVDDAQIAPGASSTWRVNVTVQSDNRPRIGSIRAGPTWADARVGGTCPRPAGENAKPRPEPEP